MSAKKLEYYWAMGGDILEFIPKDAKRILDVGCGLGLTGRTIKERMGKAVEVTGIEIEPGIAEKAKENLDTVFAGNAETTTLPFGDNYFDCIIYGDVLEHFIDPWGVLKKHAKLLKPGGVVIARIPNIAHYRTIKMLFRKEWKYEDRGILDNTHLRFFAIKSIRDMFKSSGFGITGIRRIVSASKSKKFLNKILFGAILDYITEQYIVAAQKR